MRSMMIRALLIVVAVAVTGCTSKFATYNGPEVTKLEVHKSERLLYVFHHNKLLKAYRVDLGFGPTGHKQFEGDGRTPEGRYTIDRRNPNSSFYLSLGISYPNARDIAFARSKGLPPGGDIFLHGQPNLVAPFGPDWTAGCIALTNRQMRELYAMVKNGTTIDVFP